MDGSDRHVPGAPTRQRAIALSVGLDALTFLCVVLGGLGAWTASSVDWSVEPWWVWFCMIVSGAATVILALILGTMLRESAVRRGGT
jgi:ABC-type Fe3+ transport system permease subunit